MRDGADSSPAGRLARPAPAAPARAAAADRRRHRRAGQRSAAAAGRAAAVRAHPGAGARADHRRACAACGTMLVPGRRPGAVAARRRPTSASCCSIRRACSTTASARCGRRRREQLPALAHWLRRSGVRTLAVVLPHAPGRLPEALKRGLASLDEQAVAAHGLRAPADPALGAEAAGGAPGAACWRGWRTGCCGIFKYMVPSSEQPVRAAKVAELRRGGAAHRAARHPRRRAASWCGRRRNGTCTRRCARRWLG